ncbi:MAG TPA: AAA family ATPase [Candidatus Limnocylindrales bacterium]
MPTVAITLSDRALPAGVEDRVDSVLSLPFGTFDLVHAVRAAITAGAARNPMLASRVVAVFSAKGGVGKTTIALNLAVALKELGLRTALVDGCLQFGDLRRLLRVADDLPSIIDLPTDCVRSSDLSGLMMIGPSGVEVLLAPPRLEQAELITTRDLDKIIDMLRRTYNAVVVDTPSSLGETTLAMLDAADLIIQVVTPETVALDITRLAAEAFAGIGYPQPKLQLLLNRADTQGSLSLGQIRKLFGRDPDHTIASDWALVAHSNAQGVPFLAASPDAAISTDMRAVATRVAAVVGAAPRDVVARRVHRARA